MAVLDSVLKAYQSPTRMVHAIGALSALGQEAAALNVKRPLVVTDQGIVKAGLLDEALKDLSNVRVGSFRGLLVDHARAHLCHRRGGPQQRVSLDEVCISPRTHSADLVALDEALTRLAQIDARQAQIVELRFFGGLTAEETAKILGVSTKTVNRDWLVARAWLHGEIAGRQ